ncbi:fumarylacetoacetate hydrolase family protein [Litorimonas haliclonae]|uniref:fumarylacetoacetate hydrolase family protein n=1 Tax=Litorimonas haliclonae TaxID=2081977 RepID=UPI0039EE0F8A
MTKLAFPPAVPVTLPIMGQESRFPVRRIYCVGKNYADHITEMGGDGKTAKETRSEPVFFTKAAETVVESGQSIKYPPNTSDLHHEVELVVALGPSKSKEENGSAGVEIYAYGVGIDMTRRDLQTSAKTKGGPWDRAKNFRQSAPCSALTLAKDVDLTKAHIVLRKNGDIVQHACLKDMIWSVEEIIEHLKADMDLQPGDLIYTGTPSGVGPVIIGDELSGGAEGLERITVRFI